MCGIIGYVGEKEAGPLLLGALKRMEYRGYDSSGVVVLDKEVQCIKSVGKLENLKKKTDNLSGKIGIGHNRWATHGVVSEENAHPHSDCKGEIFVVHNGIIENYKEIKSRLKDHKFSSETDTEVIAHLIEHFYNGDLEEAVRRALKVVRGAYGIVVVSKNEPQKIVAARMFSPLVVSINSSGGFVASDPTAILSHSKEMVFLEDGEVVTVTKDDFYITDLDNTSIKREKTEIEWNLEDAEKGGYPHFMLKEIHEQAESINNSIRGRINIEEGRAVLGGIEEKKEEICRAKKINIIACGTSYYAGLVGEYVIEEVANLPVEVHLASEFKYKKQPFSKEEIFLFISQSGETADTLASLKEVKKKGCLTLGIVNVVGSSIARETDAGVYNHAGPEIGVASTKAFTSQVTILSLLALFIGREKDLSLEEGVILAKDILNIPKQVEAILKDKKIEEVAKKYKDYSNFLYIGRKYNYPVALEGALKLKEVSYIHAEGYSAGEMKHGPLALIDKNFPTFAICLYDSVRDKMISNIEEIKARQGKVIVLVTEEDKKIEEIVDDLIYLPKVRELISPILSVIPLQIFAYNVALYKGLDVDQPRNLSKCVTVE
mgnify:CR=1 FL=1